METAWSFTGDTSLLQCTLRTVLQVRDGKYLQFRVTRISSCDSMPLLKIRLIGEKECFIETNALQQCSVLIPGWIF